MSQTGPRPDLELSEVLLVELGVPRTPEQVMRRVLVDDDGTIGAFHDWQAEAGVFPVAGYGQLSPGVYRCIFLAEDAPKVRAWFQEHGLLA